jgi:phosphatidylserine/phosphatidylglycerophosphate/cardiolipin synthase-like enzyme
VLEWTEGDSAELQEEKMMSVTTFLSNETYWQALSARVEDAGHVEAAIAYFGQDGAKRLPLRRGDRLLVDTSEATVPAGGTDPSEVEKLILRGVKAFTRRHLHAKIIVAGEWVIAGSANISKHSEEVLDEAAILTNVQSTVRRALEFIDRLCTEPIRREYLDKCKEIYKPPKFSGKRAKGVPSQQPMKHAKLWKVKVDERDLPKSEQQSYEQGEAEAEKLLTDEVRTTTRYVHWGDKPKMAD